MGQCPQSIVWIFFFLTNFVIPHTAVHPGLCSWYCAPPINSHFHNSLLTSPLDETVISLGFPFHSCKVFHPGVVTGIPYTFSRALSFRHQIYRLQWNRGPLWAPPCASHLSLRKGYFPSFTSEGATYTPIPRVAHNNSEGRATVVWTSAHSSDLRMIFKSWVIGWGSPKLNSAVIQLENLVD